MSSDIWTVQADNWIASKVGEYERFWGFMTKNFMQIAKYKLYCLQ